MPTDFEAKIAELARDHGLQYAAYVCINDFFEALGKVINAAGGDSSYLPGEREIEKTMIACFQPVADAEAIATERRMNANEDYHARFHRAN